MYTCLKITTLEKCICIYVQCRIATYIKQKIITTNGSGVSVKGLETEIEQFGHDEIILKVFVKRPVHLISTRDIQELKGHSLQNKRLAVFKIIKKSLVLPLSKLQKRCPFWLVLMKSFNYNILNLSLIHSFLQSHLKFVSCVALLLPKFTSNNYCWCNFIGPRSQDLMSVATSTSC